MVYDSNINDVKENKLRYCKFPDFHPIEQSVKVEFGIK